MIGKLERLTTFVRVAELGSFRAAARQLRQSPPVTTRLIAELEAELGVQLLVRTTRRLSLTVAGKAFLADAARILAELAQAEERLREEQLALTGELRISAPLSFGQHYLAATISQFRILHGGMRLRLDLDDQMVDIVAGDYDMAVRISEPPRDKSTIWRKITLVPRLIVASPDYLARRGTPQAPRDLVRHECLGYAYLAGGESWKFSNAKGEKQEVTPSFGITCNNGDLLAALAAAGEGIAMLPRFIVAARLAAGELLPLLESWHLPEVWLTAYYPPYTHLPNKVRVFTEFLEQACARELAAD